MRGAPPLGKNFPRPEVYGAMGYRKFRNDEGPQFGPPFLGFLITLTVTGVALLTIAEAQGPMGALRSMPATSAPPVEEAALTPYEAMPIGDVDAFPTSAMGEGGELGNAAGVKTSAETAVTCNVDLCANTYKSFRASDCTFQPFDGERRICTR